MRIPRLLTVAALVAAVASATVATAAPAPAGELVLPPTHTAAERIVDDYNAVNTRNNAALDIEGQAGIEAPPIKTLDDATYREFQGRGETTLSDDFTVDQVEVYVPDQSSYPLTFLAHERLTPADGSDATEQFLVFVKTSSDAPWKATLAASLLPGTATPKIATDHDDFATLVKGKTAAGLQVKPTKLAPKLAKLWQQSTDGVAIARPFEAGLLTTDIGQVFVGELQQLPINESNVNFHVTPSESQPVCFATRAKGALCFFVIGYRATLDPVNGSYVQDDTRATLGGLVPPGEYGGAIFDRTAIMLAAVPKRAPLARVDVIGLYNGLVAAQGTPKGVGIPSDTV